MSKSKNAIVVFALCTKKEAPRRKAERVLAGFIQGAEVCLQLVWVMSLYG